MSLAVRRTGGAVALVQPDDDDRLWLAALFRPAGAPVVRASGDERRDRLPRRRAPRASGDLAPHATAGRQRSAPSIRSESPDIGSAEGGRTRRPSERHADRQSRSRVLFTCGDAGPRLAPRRLARLGRRDRTRSRALRTRPERAPGVCWWCRTSTDRPPSTTIRPSAPGCASCRRWGTRCTSTASTTRRTSGGRTTRRPSRARTATWRCPSLWSRARRTFDQKIVSAGEAEFRDVSAAEGKRRLEDGQAMLERAGSAHRRVHRAGVVVRAVAPAAARRTAGIASPRITCASTTR